MTCCKLLIHSLLAFLFAAVLSPRELRSQMDSNLWLVAPGGVQPGALIEISPAGSLVAVYPGPIAGSCGVAKDRFLRRVWVCDDFAVLPGQTIPGVVRLYVSGVGLQASFGAPGMRSAAVTSGLDLAVLLAANPFSPGQVQIIPSLGTPLPPPVLVGVGSSILRAGRGDVLWTLNQLSASVSRIQAGIVQSVPVVLPAAAQMLEAHPSGGCIVATPGAAQMAVVEDSGQSVQYFPLPEAPLRIAVDGDGVLCLIGPSATFYRVHIPSGQILESWNLLGSAFGSIIPGPGGNIWIEEAGATPGVRRYGRGGTSSLFISLPAATRTLGDPFGLEHAWKADRSGDNDDDGVSNEEEHRRGTDPVDSQSLPPYLVVEPGIGTSFGIGLHAQGADGLILVVLCSLSGETPGLSLSGDGFSAPHFDLVVTGDALALGMVQGQPWVQAMFPGMPLSVIGAGGRLSFPFVLPPAAMPIAPYLRFTCAGAVIDGSLMSVRATTAPLRFDGLGNPF